MKKFSFILLSSVVLLAAGCMKDKGFDDQTYGIKNPGAGKEGVGFNLEGTVGSERNIGLDVSPNPQTIDPATLTIGYYAPTKAKSDIKVTVSIDPSIVDDYNTENGTNLQELSASDYTFNPNVIIPTGASNAAVSLSVNSTVNLDPNVTYALGVKITSVDNGINIAANMQKQILIINIKNQYDGVYLVTGTSLRLNDPVLTGTIVPYQVEYATAGVSSVAHLGSFHWAGWTAGGGSSLPTGYEPTITIDPVTNAVTSVVSGNGLISQWSGNGYVQRYDPATRTIYYQFTWGAGPTSRLMTINAKWLRAR